MRATCTGPSPRSRTGWPTRVRDRPSVRAPGRLTGPRPSRLSGRGWAGWGRMQEAAHLVADCRQMGGVSDMREVLRRIGHDLRHLRHVDAYAVALIVFVFAVLSVIGDILPVNARWTVLLVGVGVLVFRLTLPEHYEGSADDVLKDRSAFEDKPLSARLRGATEVWIFAPSAINLLAPQNVDTIRTTVLAKPDGVARVVVLDPAEETAVQFATRQLDDSLDSPSSQLFRSSLEATIGQLQRMAGWQ